MALTSEERHSIEAGLEYLHDKLRSNATGDLTQIRRYIDVGEYGLALDDLADIYLEENILLNDDIRLLFSTIATTMHMKSSEQWPAVMQILSTE